MSDSADEESAADRLEQALERIAAHALRPRPEAGAREPDDRSAVVGRLDVLIAQLRGALES